VVNGLVVSGLLFLAFFLWFVQVTKAFECLLTIAFRDLHTMFENVWQEKTSLSERNLLNFSREVKERMTSYPDD
jgi:hypothetical protein